MTQTTEEAKDCSLSPMRSDDKAGHLRPATGQVLQCLWEVEEAKREDIQINSNSDPPLGRPHLSVFTTYQVAAPTGEHDLNR